MKLSIIAEGGGMRGAYSLGAIDALYSELGLKRADFVTGSSASIGTLAYYASGQFYPGFHIWPEELPNWRFLSLRNLFRGRPFLDVDFLVDDVFRSGERQLDMKALLESPVELIVPITDSDTGEAIHLSNKKGFGGHDPWKVLKASMALPFAYGKNIELNGRLYFDGGYSDPLPIDYDGIKDTKKIIILNKNSDYPLEPGKDENFLASLTKPFLRKGVYERVRTHRHSYKRRMEEVRELERNGDIVIRPKRKFSRMDSSRANLERCIAEGRQDVLSDTRIGELMRELRGSARSEFYFD